MEPIPAEVLLLVFLHGFKGGADTFSAFPERLSTVLSASYPTTSVQSVVYPPYDTRGELLKAVDSHVEWLTTLVVEREAAFRGIGGKGPVRVVLLGHSMGGLVVADALLTIMKADAPWPTILGVIAYDTPYYGLNPYVFKNTAEKFLGYAQQGQAAITALGLGWGALASFRGNSIPPASSSKPPSRAASPKPSTEVTTATAPTQPAPSSATGWLFAAAAGAAVIAGGTAYLQKDQIATHYSWATSHLSFLGELWSLDALEKRMDAVDRATRRGVGFRCFFTLLTPTQTDPSRTFIVLPPKSSPFNSSFTPNQNNRAKDEIEAHVDMFCDKSDGMYALGGESCTVIGEWLDEARKGGDVEIVAKDEEKLV